MPCLNDNPGAVSIEGFAQANAIRDAPVSNLFQVLFSSIDQSPLIPAIRSQKLGVAGDQLPLVTRDSPAGWFPVFKTEIEKREKAPMECRVTYPPELGNKNIAEPGFGLQDIPSLGRSRDQYS